MASSPPSSRASGAMPLTSVLPTRSAPARFNSRPGAPTSGCPGDSPSAPSPALSRPPRPSPGRANWPPGSPTVGSTARPLRSSAAMAMRPSACSPGWRSWNLTGPVSARLGSPPRKSEWKHLRRWNASHPTVQSGFASFGPAPALRPWPSWRASPKARTSRRSFVALALGPPWIWQVETTLAGFDPKTSGLR